MFSRLAKIEEKFHGRMRFDLLATHPSSESRVKVQVLIFLKDVRTDKTYKQFLEERLEEGYSILESNPECVGVRRQLDQFKKASHELRFTDSGFELA